MTCEKIDKKYTNRDTDEIITLENRRKKNKNTAYLIIYVAGYNK